MSKVKVEGHVISRSRVGPMMY